MGFLSDPQFPLWPGWSTGAMADLGPHRFSLVEWLASDTITALVAEAGVFNEVCPLRGGRGSAPVPYDDAATLLIRFAGGGQGTVVMSRSATGVFADHSGGRLWRPRGTALHRARPGARRGVDRPQRR